MLNFLRSWGGVCCAQSRRHRNTGRNPHTHCRDLRVDLSVMSPERGVFSSNSSPPTCVVERGLWPEAPRRGAAGRASKGPLITAALLSGVGLVDFLDHGVVSAWPPVLDVVVVVAAICRLTHAVTDNHQLALAAVFVLTRSSNLCREITRHPHGYRLNRPQILPHLGCFDYHSL
jgi:hypothetical protein